MHAFLPTLDFIGTFAAAASGDILAARVPVVLPSELHAIAARPASVRGIAARG